MYTPKIKKLSKDGLYGLYESDFKALAYATLDTFAAASKMLECLESLIGKTGNPLIDQHIQEIVAKAKGE